MAYTGAGFSPRTFRLCGTCSEKNEPMNFLDLKRNLKKDYSGLKEIRVFLAADSASQLLAQALKGYGYEAGLNFKIHEADYDQIDLQVADPGSGLYQSKPDFVVIFHSVQKIRRKFYRKPVQERAHFAGKHLDYVRDLAETVSSRTGANIIYFNFPLSDDSVFGNYSNKLPQSWNWQLREINTGLMKLAASSPALHIADLEMLVSRTGLATAFDAKMYVNADMAFALDFLPLQAKAVTDIILAISGRFKKCLIIDLDNTMWGGIIGDDGLENIQVGMLGLGKAFSELQLWIKQLKERGIVLAICSKNDERIAREPFEKHPDMILRPEDIAVFVANWETKVDNIRHIQSVLNIGFDTMVFLDDNPFERNIVREHIPGILVPELPEDPAEYLPYLHSLNLFETASFSEEDTQRTKQYQEEAGRVQLQKTFASENDFLRSLDMTASVRAFDSFDVPRVAQLSQRSNQFNLRTVRYTETDIQRIMNSDKHVSYSVSLKDKFGDYGLISVVILEKKSDELFIDTWIMSCRVLKRGVENFLLNRIATDAVRAGFPKLRGEYLPTAKNALVKDHYASLGFVETGGSWILELDKYSEKNSYISTET